MSKRSALGRLSNLSCLVLATLVVVTNSLSVSQTTDAQELNERFRYPLPDTYPELVQAHDTCNVYLLRDKDSCLAFNFGDGTWLPLIEQEDGHSIDRVLITSHHRENLQGLARTSDLKLATSEAEKEILEDPTSFRKWYPTLGDKYSVYGASYVRPPATPATVDKTLGDNEVFRWHGFEVRCLLTPGNSPGGMTYLIDNGKQRVAICGGLIHEGAKFSNWYDSEWDYGFAVGLDQLIQSVKRLIEEDVDVLLPSQGPVILDAKTQLQTYLQKLSKFRASYVRGYPVEEEDPSKRDPISKPTPVVHINQVSEHLFKLSHTTKSRNFAIIVADNGHALVLDCGLIPAQMLDEIVVGMREHMGLKQIDAFWISHMHGDHFLLGPHLKANYGAKAWTLDIIADRCEHPRRYDYAALVSAYGDGFDGMKIDKQFRNGEAIEWEGYQIQVDWMPGQTEFGCCLWLDIDGQRVAFTGDNLFGDSSDEKQTGHEAVVSRNSAILEEGYITGSQYLLDLEPDLIMGAHSYVMPNPIPFLQRYNDWSKSIRNQYQDLIPEKNYEYGFDPYWVSAYPYRVDLTETNEQTISVTVRNFKDVPQRHSIELVLPEGIEATPAKLEGTVDAHSEKSFTVKLKATRRDGSPKTNEETSLQIVPFDITLDGKRYGQRFDFLIRTAN